MISFLVSDNRILCPRGSHNLFNAFAPFIYCFKLAGLVGDLDFAKPTMLL